jgi:transposase-like protein
LQNPKSENKIFEGFQIAGALLKGAEGCTQEVRVAVAESYLEGVSTRKVQKVFSNSDLENISASEVPKNHKKVGQIGQ